jgi:uncharacterized protein YndB with AHSA1/START domain
MTFRLDAPPDQPFITVWRTFAAPPSRVFAAWTDAALLRRWLAPSPCVVVEAQADARVGGTYRIVVQSPEGTRHTTTGEYREVSPPVRLVKTWVYEGPNYAGPYPTLVTVDFRESASGGTELKIRQEGLLRPEDRAGNGEGWRLCLDNLEALLAGGGEAP